MGQCQQSVCCQEIPQVAFLRYMYLALVTNYATMIALIYLRMLATVLPLHKVIYWYASTALTLHHNLYTTYGAAGGNAPMRDRPSRVVSSVPKCLFSTNSVQCLQSWPWAFTATGNRAVRLISYGFFSLVCTVWHIWQHTAFFSRQTSVLLYLCSYSRSLALHSNT